MNLKERRYGTRQFGSRHEYLRSIEKALIVALYFAVIASGAVALGAQLLSD